MKITIVTHSIYPDSIGGREKYVYYLADVLGKRGHEVKVFTCSKGFASRVKKYKNFAVYYFPSLDIPLKEAVYRIPVLMLDKLLKDDADIFHVYDLHHFTSFVTALAAHVKKKPLIITECGYPPLEGLMHYLIKIYDKTLLKYIERRSNKFIAVSDFISNELNERYNVPRGKITRIYNAIDTGNFRIRNQQFKKRYNLSNKRIILGVGRLTKEKGFQHLIKAFKKISTKFPDTTLVIIGPNKSYKHLLDKLIKDLGLGKKVILTGAIDEELVKDAIRSCEMLVIPSEYEPLPLVAFEALSYGKPVIATSVGGMPEIFNHKINGLMAKPRSPDDLAEKIKILLTNKKLKAKITANSEKTLKKFDWRKTVSKIEEIYENFAE